MTGLQTQNTVRQWHICMEYSPWMMFYFFVFLTISYSMLLKGLRMGPCVMFQTRTLRVVPWLRYSTCIQLIQGLQPRINPACSDLHNAQTPILNLFTKTLTWNIWSKCMMIWCWIILYFSTKHVWRCLTAPCHYLRQLDEDSLTGNTQDRSCKNVVENDAREIPEGQMRYFMQYSLMWSVYFI